VPVGYSQTGWTLSRLAPVLLDFSVPVEPRHGGADWVLSRPGVIKKRDLGVLYAWCATREVAGCSRANVCHANVRHAQIRAPADRAHPPASESPRTTWLQCSRAAKQRNGLMMLTESPITSPAPNQKASATFSTHHSRGFDAMQISGLVPSAVAGLEKQTRMCRKALPTRRSQSNPGSEICTDSRYLCMPWFLWLERGTRLYVWNRGFRPLHRG